MKNVNAGRDFYGVQSLNNAFALLTLLFQERVVYAMKITLWLMGNVLLTVKLFIEVQVMRQVGNNVNVNQDIISLNFKLVRQDVNLTVHLLKTPSLSAHKLIVAFAYKICIGRMECVKLTVTMLVMQVESQQLSKINAIVQ